jgi:putative membrane protein
MRVPAMTRFLATPSVTALLACASPAWAQWNALSPSGPKDPAATGANNPAGQLAVVDQAFVEKAARSGTAEVELGKPAAGKASDQDVKEMTQLIVREHEQANQELMTLVHAEGAE